MVDLLKCSYYHYLTKKVINKQFSELDPTSWRENSWRRYGIKKLRHCHSMYIPEVRVFEFCPQLDHIKYLIWDDKLP